MLNINAQKNLLKKVLVLDNDPTILEVMEEALIYEGFLVDIYERTDNILQLIKQHQPDLLIVDFLLEGINGGDVCRKVKNNFTTCNIPVIIFSAYPIALELLEVYGCNAFISKPFDLAELLNKITELIYQHQKTSINTQLNGY